MPHCVEVFFLPGAKGQRLCVHYSPSEGSVRGAFVYVHPWAEEMNKSRRMAALQARALAEAGFAVLQVDLHGCGDSSGDFGDATWAGWHEDVATAVRWLRLSYPQAPLWLWGLRAGALLAAAAAQEQQARVLLWQPALAGKALLQQFMRLNAVAGLDRVGVKDTSGKLRQELAAGRSIEVAGYRVAATLAAGLESATLATPAAGCAAVWIEVTTREPATLLPASATLAETWRTAGHCLSAQAVNGPAFWQTQEIEDAPALIHATLAAVVNVA